jgi:hypothetical protein
MMYLHPSDEAGLVLRLNVGLQRALSGLGNRRIRFLMGWTISIPSMWSMSLFFAPTTITEQEIARRTEVSGFFGLPSRATARVALIINRNVDGLLHEALRIHNVSCECLSSRLRTDVTGYGVGILMSVCRW